MGIFGNDDDGAGDGTKTTGGRKLKSNATVTYQKDAAGLWVYMLDKNGPPIFLGRVGYDRNPELERVERIVGKPQSLDG